MLLRNLLGCSALGVCLVLGCGDGGRTIYIINAGGALPTGGAQATGGAAQGGSATSGGNGSGGGDAGGSQGGSNSGAGGATGTSGGMGSGGGAGGECNALPAGDAVFEATATGSPIPTMSGGAIYDGIYRYIQRVDYDGSCDCSHTQVFVISGGGTQFQENYDGMKQNGILTASGTTLTFNYTCPTARTYSVEYTASDIELRIWTADDLRLDVFTRQ